MPVASKTPQAPASASPPAVPPGSFCAVEEREGQAIVHFRLDAVTLGRIKRKAYVQGDDPVKFANWLWQNILRPGIEGIAY